MKYTCGIDWASDHHDVSIVNERGMEVKCLRIEDNLKDYRELLQVLRGFGGEILNISGIGETTPSTLGFRGWKVGSVSLVYNRHIWLLRSEMAQLIMGTK